MRGLMVRRLGWLVAMASAFGAACSSRLVTTQTEALPPPCSAPLPDGGVLPNLTSPVHGSVTGSEVVATLCNGGASAYLERTAATVTPPDKLLVFIDSETVDPTRDFKIALPTAATRLQLAVNVGVSAAQPGTYTEAGECGDIILCAVMPPPASVQCPTTPQSDTCPPGCMFVGSLPCVPSEPTTCYEAATGSTCNGGGPPGGARGSWHLTLSSVEPYDGPDSAAPNDGLFVIHGSLDATLLKIVDGASSAGASQVNLSLSF